jgi:plastocyanin
MKIFVVVSLLVLLAVIITGCTQPVGIQPTQTPSPTPSMSPVQPPLTPVLTPISQGSVSENTIAIKNFAFDPQTLTVNAGATVRWVNYDSVTHRVVFKDTAGRDIDVDSSPLLSASQSWSSSKFDKPGTYSYYCKIHPDMTGTVIVV